MYEEYAGSSIVPLTISSAVVELDQFTHGWPLAEPGEPDREEVRAFRTHVVFNAPFANVPMVHVGLSGFDIDNDDTIRLSVRADAVSASGFDLVVETWLGTRVYKVEVSWIALGHQAVG